MGQFAILWRALTDAALRSAREHIIALYSGIGIVAFVLFLSKNGMDAHDLTRLAHQHSGFRIGLTLLWLTASLPAARALTLLPSTFLLRSLPVPRNDFVVIHWIHLSLAELPWLLLWLRGEGVAVGMAQCMAAAAAHAWIIVRPRGTKEWLAALAILAVLLAPAPTVLFLSVSTISAGLGVLALYRRAPEVSSKTTQRRFTGPAWLALAKAWLVVLARRDPAARIRAILATLTGAAAATLLIRNNAVASDARSSAVSLAVASVSLAIALSPIAASVLRTERRERWLLDSSGTDDRTRRQSVLAATGTWGTAMGAAHASLVAIFAFHQLVPALLSIGLGALWGLAQSAAMVAAVRSAESRVNALGDAEVDGTRAFLGAAAIAVIGSLCLGIADSTALTVLVPIWLIVGWRAAGARALPRGHRSQGRLVR